MIRSSVVLPAPLAPTSATLAPSPTRKETSSSSSRPSGQDVADAVDVDVAHARRVWHGRSPRDRFADRAVSAGQLSRRGAAGSREVDHHVGVRPRVVALLVHRLGRQVAAQVQLTHLRPASRRSASRTSRRARAPARRRRPRNTRQVPPAGQLRDEQERALDQHHRAGRDRHRRRVHRDVTGQVVGRGHDGRARRRPPGRAPAGAARRGSNESSR